MVVFRLTKSVSHFSVIAFKSTFGSIAHWFNKIALQVKVTLQENHVSSVSSLEPGVVPSHCGHILDHAQVS